MSAQPASLSEAQLEALSQCRSLLRSVGLESLIPSPAQLLYSKTVLRHDSGPSVPHPVVLGSRYIPPPARPFTQVEIERKENRVTRKLAAQAVVHHPLHALVEFPQTGRTSEERILHLFDVDPDSFHDPANDFQYSFNESHGQDDATTCFLCDNTGAKISCKKRHGRCSSVKTCSFSPVTSVTPVRRHGASLDASFHDATKELFLKTVAFYCALMRYGCNFDAQEDSQRSDIPLDDSDDDDYSSPAADLEAEFLDSYDQSAHEYRAPVRCKCSGKLVMFFRDNQYFIKCSLYAPGARGHLLLSGIDQYHVDYLTALLSDDMDTCERYETEAAERGYGPLHHCEFVTSVRSQARCSDIHRFPDGRLAHGELVVAQDCPARCDVFIPVREQLSACPRVAVLCTGSHNHPDPARTKTPQPICTLFGDMLTLLDWQVADITPRRLVLNGAFMERLKMNLAWSDKRLPSLADLHESLRNLDHLAYLMNTVRRSLYPDGTGFQAARALLDADIPPDLRYVRAAETRTIKGKDVQFIICMSPAQSALLLHARCVTIDTAFKRVKGWYELELEVWDDATHRSVTVGRAFLNSLTADAHFELFKCLDSIIKTDCGSHIQFSYLHGRGWDTVHTDQHKGQAMGIGMFAAWLANETLSLDNPFTKLTPLEHLAFFLMLCVAHYKRNLLKIQCKVRQQPVIGSKTR
ncbi:hypothetical protein AURDEDRAFT_164998 [Auricularia subglabra TFB-10046 SS5]|nr:hypothetical protein AURDEDRAFT_164998 [Auricularia subglabra TFB-10046 SS5]